MYVKLEPAPKIKFFKSVFLFKQKEYFHRKMGLCQSDAYVLSLKGLDMVSQMSPYELSLSCL